MQLLILIIQNRKPKDKTDAGDEYVIATQQLNVLISNYKEHVFEPSLEALTTKYDTNEKSQTNALNLVLQETAELERKAVSDIIENHLTDDLKDIIGNYFTSDSLILFIIKHLKQ